MIFKKELFGALNDGSGKVRIYIDRFFEGNLMDAHPNDNAATMFLKADDVIGFLRSTGRTADYIDLSAAVVLSVSLPDNSAYCCTRAGVFCVMSADSVRAVRMSVSRSSEMRIFSSPLNWCKSRIS